LFLKILLILGLLSVDEDELVILKKNVQPNLASFQYIDDLKQQVTLVLHASVMWILPVHN
jgi:hypothetical protein